MDELDRVDEVFSSIGSIGIYPLLHSYTEIPSGCTTTDILVQEREREREREREGPSSFDFTWVIATFAKLQGAKCL